MEGSPVTKTSIASRRRNRHTCLNPVINKATNYDLVKDFEPVLRIVSFPSVLVFSPSLGVNSVAELIALAKRQRSALCLGQADDNNYRHPFQAEPGCCRQAAVTGNDDVMLVDEQWICETKSADGGRDLSYLFVIGCAGVSGIRLKVSYTSLSDL